MVRISEDLIEGRKRFVDEEKPYWLDLTGGTRFSGELRFVLENYFPEAHYRKAAKEEEQLMADGGRYTETLYAWHDPDTDTYLSRVEAGDEFATPFFEDEEGARQFLEHRAQEIDDESRFEGLSLHKFRAKQIGEAVEVLTNQSGIEDFVPDGGTHQIDNPEQDEIWFWYDPTVDAIIQEEVEPYEVVGVFETENDADRFIQEYADQYGLDDLTHLEKYCAELSYEGQGPFLEDTDSTEPDTGETEQADFDGFLS